MSSLLQPLLSNITFQQRHIDPLLKHVIEACRDTSAHSYARDLVPIADILALGNNADILDDESSYKDNLLPLLVDWFSTIFFRWFETPSCDICTGNLTFHGSFVNPEGKQVEKYHCDKDGFEFLFVRHNEPAILLHTRAGRCGEWAMCFFTILRAMDYHARIVYDSTDHVWNEVWSDKRHEFIHVDPCENIVDTPLLYEVGWGKKLEYCIAMGQYEIVDVTRRYCVDFEATRSRRNQCDETWLNGRLDEITAGLLMVAESNECKSTISSHRTMDIETLNLLSSSPREIPDKSQLAGRKTGSMEWRIARGEYIVSAKKEFVIKIEPKTSGEQETANIFHLEYNCDRNRYHSNVDSYNDVSSWLSLAYEYANLDYKYERDWKTSYVARYDGCPYDKIGLVRWRLNLEDVDWQKIEILVTGKLYPGTSVSIKLYSYASTDCSSVMISKDILLNERAIFERSELEFETKMLDLVVTTAGGSADDEVAWQKPQLFRQTKGQNSDKSALLINIA